jgi:aerobic-type carbon monoxide dehydrogenase small subunit (CoxS/CutS family)
MNKRQSDHRRGEEMIGTIDFQLNGKPVRLALDGERKLLWVLRTDLALTGTKYGCGKALCGACTVLVNRKAVRSCQEIGRAHV